MIYDDERKNGYDKGWKEGWEAGFDSGRKELLKEQQKKKIELLGKFDKEIEEAREAVEDCACDGDHSGVVYFQHKQHDFQYARAIIENVL